MTDAEWAALLARVETNQDIFGGAPQAHRIPVALVLTQLAIGETVDTLCEDHPDWEREDVLACLVYAAEIVRKPQGGL
jgi:uncharacterized protein (DUF433 family)